MEEKKESIKKKNSLKWGQFLSLSSYCLQDTMELLQPFWNCPEWKCKSKQVSLHEFTPNVLHCKKA